MIARVGKNKGGDTTTIKLYTTVIETAGSGKISFVSDVFAFSSTFLFLRDAPLCGLLL